MVNTLTPPVTTTAIIGLGSVGSGWAALMLAKDIKVQAYDPGKDAQAVSQTLIEGAWPSLIALGLTEKPAPPFEDLHFDNSIAAAVLDADVVFENVPERITVKHEVLAAIDAAAPSNALILSSTGGIETTALQSVCQYPERVVVMHPFNPSHLIPLVEIVPGEKTGTQYTDRALAFARAMGKHPILLKREMDGHMVNRLQFALVREAIRCLNEGVASAEDIDAAVRYGLAPRWLLMGGLHTVAMAGGPGGMQGILDHAGHAMEKWWATDAKFKLTPALKEALAEAANGLNQGAAFADWAAWRDQQLVTLLRLQTSADYERPDARSDA
ncbi:MAG: 3-hydroxyacyl-CoA dehydrogenase NAD-binding domain-containing protein [Pseudomonadota bacterium]